MVKSWGKVAREVPIWGGVIKDKYQGKTIGETYTKDASFNANVDLEYDDGILPTLSYDDSDFLYDSPTKEVLATQDETEIPIKGAIIDDNKEKSGKIIKRMNMAKIITSS